MKLDETKIAFRYRVVIFPLNFPFFYNLIASVRPTLMGYVNAFKIKGVKKPKICVTSF